MSVATTVTFVYVRVGGRIRWVFVVGRLLEGEHAAIDVEVTVNVGPSRFQVIAVPSGSTAVYVATGPVPFSAYMMVVGFLRLDKAAGQQEQQAHGQDREKRNNREGEAPV